MEENVCLKTLQHRQERKDRRKDTTNYSTLNFPVCPWEGREMHWEDGPHGRWHCQLQRPAESPALQQLRLGSHHPTSPVQTPLHSLGDLFPCPSLPCPRTSAAETPPPLVLLPSPTIPVTACPDKRDISKGIFI